MKIVRAFRKVSMLALITALAGNAFAQAQEHSITPHFTDKSIEIVLPKDAIVSPRIIDGLIRINYGGLAFADLQGKYVFGTDFGAGVGNAFANSGEFSGGAVMVWRNKKPNDFAPSPAILYPNGKYRELPSDISNVSQFEDGVALAQKGASVIMGVKQIFIDKNGKEIYPKLASTQRGSFGDMKIYPLSEKMRVYYNADLKKYGYADDKGNIAIKPQFEKAASFSEGMAAVQVDGKWGFIDTKGKLAIPATYYLQPGKFSEGLAPVRIGEQDYDFEMSYIDKKGARAIPNTKWLLNEFHDGFAWTKQEGCDKIVIIDKEFKPVKDITKTFTEYDSPDVCFFKMQHEGSSDYGFGFPNGQIAAHTNGPGPGDIYTPAGDRILKAFDKDGKHIPLYPQTEGGLHFAVWAFGHEERIKNKNAFIPIFVNAQGEIVYYFQEGKEGYEGPKPALAK